MKEYTLSIFPQLNEVVLTDRSGSLRAAKFPSVPTTHVNGKLQVYWGLLISVDIGNCTHLRWTGLGLETNIVEECRLRAALLHVRHPWAPRCSRSERIIYCI